MRLQLVRGPMVHHCMFLSKSRSSNSVAPEKILEVLVLKGHIIPLGRANLHGMLQCFTEHVHRIDSIADPFKGDFHGFSIAMFYYQKVRVSLIWETEIVIIHTQLGAICGTVGPL